MKRVIALVIALFALWCAAPATLWADGNKMTAPEFEFEFDPYYTSFDIYMSLTKSPIPQVRETAESEIYYDMLKNALRPRFVVLEASVNPMPVLGLLAKDRMPHAYEESEMGEVNMIKAVTAGFEEPYALSLFLGNVVHFMRPGSEDVDANVKGNKGFMGYLLSVGDRHIMNNELVDDNWYELEWKIKGDRVFSTNVMSWSLRLGAKIHGNGNIADVVYFSVRRSRLDYDAPALSLLKNSAFEYTYEVEKDTFKTVQQAFFIEKKFPHKKVKAAFTLAVGFILESDRKYSGSLSDGSGENLQFIIRPNITF